MMLAFGMVCALSEAQALRARASGRRRHDRRRGDAGGDDLLVPRGRPMARRPRGQPARRRRAVLRAYACADGEFVAVGALEPQFFAALLKGLGIAEGELPDRWRPDTGRPSPRVSRRSSRRNRATHGPRRSLATDACVTPVLSLDEAPAHPHNAARAAFRGASRLRRRRFSRTPGGIAGSPVTAGQGGEAALRDRGVSTERIAELRACGALATDADEACGSERR